MVASMPIGYQSSHSGIASSSLVKKSLRLQCGNVAGPSNNALLRACSRRLSSALASTSALRCWAMEVSQRALSSSRSSAAVQGLVGFADLRCIPYVCWLCECTLVEFKKCMTTNSINISLFSSLCDTVNGALLISIVPLRQTYGM